MIEIYDFDELSESAQDVALDEVRRINSDYEVKVINAATPLTGVTASLVDGQLVLTPAATVEAA